jgi:ketosteroid isomerase-like protein
MIKKNSQQLNDLSLSAAERIRRDKADVPRLTKIIPVVLCLFLIFFKTSGQSKTLYQTIAELDSIFFHAYNTCDIKMQSEFYSDSIEFYHDQGGLVKSKQVILEATEKNICGKVTRELVKGSIEVSPIPGYGAVEIGMHMFHNNQEKGQVPHASRFVVIWRNREDKWTIERVISLH